eukprot:2906767-Rhodomonas_salina.1
MQSSLKCFALSPTAPTQPHPSLVSLSQAAAVDATSGLDRRLRFFGPGLRPSVTPAWQHLTRSLLIMFSTSLSLVRLRTVSSPQRDGQVGFCCTHFEMQSQQN